MQLHGSRRGTTSHVTGDAAVATVDVNQSTSAGEAEGDGDGRRGAEDGMGQQIEGRGRSYCLIGGEGEEGEWRRRFVAFVGKRKGTEAAEACAGRRRIGGRESRESMRLPAVAAGDLQTETKKSNGNERGYCACEKNWTVNFLCMDGDRLGRWLYWGSKT
jgi:hypothetical protein